MRLTIVQTALSTAVLQQAAKEHVADGSATASGAGHIAHYTSTERKTDKEVGCGIHAKHKFFFTFGQNTNLKNSYVVLEEENSVIARKKMIDQYGTVWAFQYSQTQFEGQPERYGLNEVVFGTRIFKQE